MNHVSFAASVRTECYQIWERCKRTLASLFGLFQRATAPLAYDHVSPPLAGRKIAIGGVENVGNSCIFSTMLQDFAAEPAFYDTFFTSPLQQGDEDQTRFALRQQLQRHLYNCIRELRAGNTVKKENVRQLAHLLQQLGWNGHLVSSWRLFLNRIAPTLFPIPVFSPHHIYDTVLALFAEASNPAHRIVLMGKDLNTPLEKLIENSPAFRDNQQQTLWKIAVDPQENLQLQEQFQLQDSQFSLKLVHLFLKTPHGNHVLVYRKENEGWVCCNDAQIMAVKTLPSTNIYSVVYESRIK